MVENKKTAMVANRVKPASILSKIVLVQVISIFMAVVSFGQELTELRSFIGHYDYTIIGNTQHLKDDCNRIEKSKASLDIPMGATAVAAYLYWSGSSQFVSTSPYIDDDVKLNGKKITAQRTWTASSKNAGTLYHSYGAFADITSLIHSSKTIEISDLWWNNSILCEDRSAYGGWVLMVVYSHQALPFKSVHVFDGLKMVNAAKPVIHTWNNISIPSCDAQSRIALVTWDADKDLNENILIDESIIGINELGSDRSDLDMDLISLPPTKSFGPSSIVKIDKTTFEDQFVIQLSIVDFISCSDKCDFIVPPDTTLFCNTEIDSIDAGMASSSCDLAISFEDIIVGTCPKLVQRNWIGKPKLSLSCEESRLVFYPLNCTSFEAINCNAGGMKPVISQNHCSQIKASSFCRPMSENSCVFRENDPNIPGQIADAICTAGWNKMEWQNDSEKSLQFDIQFSGEEVGCLTSINFYEKVNITQINGDPNRVNYPRNFGVVVFKNGEEIFRNVQQTTSIDWTFQELRFDGIESFCYEGESMFTFEIQAFNPLYYTHSSIWEIDEVSINGCCSSPVYGIQLLTILDTIAPTLNCELSDVTFSCDNKNAVNRFSAWHKDNLDQLKSCVTDDCSASLEITSDFSLDNIELSCGNNGSITVTYSITDDCENVKQVAVSASIEDNEAPIVKCQDISIQVIEGQPISIAAESVDDGSVDGCADIVDFNVIVPSLEVENCGNQVVGQLIGIDACGLRDTCSFNVAIMCYDLALVKQVRSNNNFILGDTVIFDIYLINQGNLAATSIDVVDYLPQGLTVLSDDWSITEEGVAHYNLDNVLNPGDTAKIVLYTTINSLTESSSLVNRAEIFSSTVESDYINVDVDSKADENPENDLVVDNATDNEEGDEDDHDIAILNVEFYDLAINKSIEVDTILSGEVATFNFVLENQGSLPAYNIEVVDYLPQGFENESSEWMIENGLAKLIIDSILPGESIEFELMLNTSENIQSKFEINTVEISSAVDFSGKPITDIDSDYDQNPLNDLEEEDDFSEVSFRILNCTLLVDEDVIIRPSCPGGADGAIDINISGGDLPYTITWSNGATTQNLENLPAGIYRLNVVDNFGCSVEKEFLIEDPDGLSCSISTETDFFGFGVSKSGALDGRVRVDIIGGSSPYVIEWNTGDTSATVTNLGAGVYNVSVTDANGCTCESEVELTEPQPLDCGIISLAPISCPGFNDASLGIEVRGGVEPYNYLWSTQDTIQELTDLRVGVYRVTISDRLRDTCVSEFEVAPPTPLEASASSEAENCTAKNGSIELTVDGGSLPYTFIWNTGDTLQNLDKLSTGSYMVTITDANGCTFVLEQNVDQIECAGVGDFVWKDLNQNGIQDEEEPGANGMTVLLRNALTLEILDTFITRTNVVTGIDGFYLFENVEAGIYQVIFLKDNTFEFTISNAGDAKVDSDADPNTGVSFSFMIEPGELLETIDAGVLLYNLIGDRVWFDQNGDGIQNNDEPGLANIKVFLNDSTGMVLDSVLSDQNGFYLFNKLDSGFYVISVDLPEEIGDNPVEFTSMQVGDDRDNDSDIDPLNSRSSIIEITSCSQIRSIDIGIRTLTQQLIVSGSEEFTAAMGKPIIFPNPASGQIKINIPINASVDAVDLLLFDAQGKNIKTWKEINALKSNMIYSQMDVSSYESGVYYIQIISNNQLRIIPFEIFN